MNAIFSDPQLAKFIIFVLLAIVVVLTIAVILLAIQKNRVVYLEPEVKPTMNNTRVMPDVVQEKPLVLEKAKDGLDIIQFDEVKDEAGATNVVEAMDKAPSQELVRQKPVHPTHLIHGVKLAITMNNVTSHATIVKFPCILGREKDRCDVVLSEPAVSRRHAKLSLENGEVFISDVSEHNGTFINEHKLASLSSSRIKEGDVITLGRVKLKVEAFLYGNEGEHGM